MYEMHGKKFWKKFLIASVAVGVINFSLVISYENNLQIVSVAKAEIKKYEAVGRAEFNFGENNPKLVEMAKNYARMNAVQAAKEKAGIYLKSISRTVNGVLTDDDISVVASNSAEILDVKFKQMPYVSHDVHGNITGEIGIAYEATVIVKIDSDALSKYIQRDQQEKSTLIEQNKDSQKNIADINKTVEELKNNPQKATSAEVEKINNKILAQQKLNEGRNLIGQNNYQGAVSKLTESIALFPNSPETYVLRGTAYANLGNVTQAVLDYDKAVQLKPSNKLLHYIKTWCEFQGWTFVDSEEYTKAIQFYDESIKIDPNYARAYVARGSAYANLKNYSQAISDYTKAIELNPNDRHAYEQRAHVYDKLKDYEKAIWNYDKALQLSPDEYVYFQRGEIYRKLEKYEQAVKDFSTAIDLDPSYASAYKSRGIVYHYLKNYNQAIEDYTKVIQLAPKHSEAYYNRGIAYYYLKKYEKAIGDYTRTIQLNKNGALAYNARGLAYFSLAKYEKAIEDYRKCIELNPNDYQAYNNCGNAYKHLKDYKQAVFYYTKAILSNPKYAEAYYNRADIYYVGLSNYSQAIDDYTKYIQLDPNGLFVLVAYSYRGMSYELLGKYDEAIEDYTKCIQLYPNDKYAYQWRGECYVKIGEHKKAEKDFAKARELGYDN